MRVTSKRLSLLFVVLPVLSVALTVPAFGQKFRARLGGFQEVPALSTTASGSFELTITDAGLDYELSYSGLEANVVAAHIHLGQPAVAGGVIAFLCGGGGKDPCPQSGTVTGTITPQDVVGPAAQGIEAGAFEEVVRAIRAGSVYANVHSEKFPAGEIRGQLGRRFFGFGTLPQLDEDEEE